MPAAERPTRSVRGRKSIALPTLKLKMLGDVDALHPERVGVLVRRVVDGFAPDAGAHRAPPGAGGGVTTSPATWNPKSGMPSVSLLRDTIWLNLVGTESPTRTTSL
jgi:hypothetical protein